MRAAGDSVAKSQQAPAGEATKAAAPEAAGKPGNYLLTSSTVGAVQGIG